MTNKRWEEYERVATLLLNQFASEFGLSRVEGKQPIVGMRSGTHWTIDAKGVLEGSDAFVIVECRRYPNTKQSQEKLGGLAYRISDTGAAGGIVVSPMGLQAGAQKIADAEGVISVELYQDSTPTEFAMQFLNKIFVGIHESVSATDEFSASVIRTCDRCSERFEVVDDERVCPSCAARA